MGQERDIVDQITEAAVREALAAVRYARSLDGPLVDLTLVESRLHAEGIVASPENARWAVATLLDELVWAELTRLRGAGRAVDREALTPVSERELLAADFRAGNADLEGWSALHVRYLSTAGLQMAELPEIVGVSRATVARRLGAAVAHLTDMLRARERAARREADRRPGAPASDRIVVAGGEPAEAETEAAALLAAVRDDARVVRLSPAQLAAVAGRETDDLEGFRLKRIAEWSLPRYRLDDRFVDLSLLIDGGDESGTDRWQVQEMRFGALGDVLREMQDPALVLLGPPGSGKSTLLRRLELDLAVAGLRGETEALTFFVQLNQFRPARPGADLPAPAEWLAEQWSSRFPGLAPLPELLADGGLVLLLDALNEIPHTDQSDYRAQVLLWKQFVGEVVAAGRGNRVLLSCRSLEYSAPISTPELRVPQVRIEPLSDARIERFLHLYSPGRADDLWRRLRGTPQLDLVRSPYFLKLLVDQVAASDEVPRGRAALFTGFVRQALRREIRRDNPLFQPGPLLAERDYDRVVRARRWGSPHELPSRGRLFPKLAELAHRMQLGEPMGEAAQVRVGYDAALALLDDPHGEDVLRAGVALAVVDEDTGRDEVLFFHQLLQEYFAGRHMAADLQPDLVQAEWLADRQQPAIEDTLVALGPAEPLPPLPLTHWEETTLLAAEMADDKAAFIERLTAANLALAGRCAAQSVVRAHLPQAQTDRLRAALVARSRDRSADLRARIEAGLALGRLGDPRFERREGPHGPFLAPPLVSIPAGQYVIGSDDTYSYIGKTFEDHMPAHTLELAGFALGAFPVTNAEFRLFVEAGGYDDERWWETDAARRWRRGEDTLAGDRMRYRYWARVFGDRPELLDELLEYGRLDDEAFARWQQWSGMVDDELEAVLREAFPDVRHTEPESWGEAAFGNPLQPVVGVTWFETRAYCAWLSAQTGRPFRLPSEAEWEAAGRGRDGRRYAYGDEPAALCGNALQTHLQQPTPVGVFPDGDTPEGLADVSGNVLEWTASRWGQDPERPEFRYPYVPDDGRETDNAPPAGRRVLRGGSFYHSMTESACVMRARHHPTARDAGISFRLATTPD